MCPVLCPQLWCLCSKFEPTEARHIETICVCLQQWSAVRACSIPHCHLIPCKNNTNMLTSVGREVWVWTDPLSEETPAWTKHPEFKRSSDSFKPQFDQCHSLSLVLFGELAKKCSSSVVSEPNRFWKGLASCQIWEAQPAIWLSGNVWQWQMAIMLSEQKADQSHSPSSTWTSPLQEVWGVSSAPLCELSPLAVQSVSAFRVRSK